MDVIVQYVRTYVVIDVSSHVVTSNTSHSKVIVEYVVVDVTTCHSHVVVVRST